MVIASPVAAQFFSDYVSSIVVRNNRDVQAFQSASRNAYIGEVVLLNPHLEFADDAYLAESLVHESIHSLMWRAEILSHFLNSPGKGEVVVTSPWTGQQIYYYTLLQAVFVWYGVFNFWLDACAARRAFDQNRAELLRDRAAKGFLVPGFQNSVREHSHLLQEGILETFTSMQDAVIAAVKAI